MPFTLAISNERVPFLKNAWLLIFTAIFLAVWIYSFVRTTDLNNWLIENTLTAIFLLFLVITYRKHQMSDLSYLLICVYLCMHVYGSMKTYSEAPLGFKMQEWFGTKRNPYDRMVHFGFGFLLAYPMREFFLRWLKAPKWAAWLLPIEISLSFGALYELIEWAVADLIFPEQGGAYLGTQGDIWDAQKDIFMAFLGAVIATTIISSVKTIFRIDEASVNS